MPVTLTYNYAATACPALLTSGALLNPADANTGTPTATYASEIQDGDNGFIMAPKFGDNAVRLDNVGRFGGGGYGICAGLVPSITSGLTVAWTEGQVGVDSGIYVAADSRACTDNAVSHFWVLSGGTISAAQATTAPPAGAVAYLGRFTAASGVITEMDQSGVLFCWKRGLYRRTGDVDLPADTPPADHLIRTVTQSGTFMWTGSAYSTPAQAGRSAVTMTDANHTLAAANYRKAVLSLAATLTAPRDVLLPNIDGLTYIVHNNTTGGFTLTFKVSGQTGVAVPAGARAEIYCNGTDYVRVLASSVASTDLAPSALALIPGAPTLTLAAQVSHTRSVTVQLKDSGGTSIAAKRLVRVWLSDSALGGETAAVPDGGVAVTTGVLLRSETTNKHFLVLTDATGAAVIAVTHSVAITYHVIAEFAGQITDAAVALT